MSEQLLMTDSQSAIGARPATLLDLLDRLLDIGAVIDGRVLISIADIDLIYLNLKLLLSSVEAVRGKKLPTESTSNSPAPMAPAPMAPAPIAPAAMTPNSTVTVTKPKTDVTATKPKTDQGAGSPPITESNVQTPPQESAPKKLWGPEGFVDTAPTKESERKSAHKLNLKPEKVQHDVAKLLLTIAELLRQLMERQAVERMSGGSLNSEQIEKLGQGLMALENTVKELKRTFNLQDEELNIDLGPLGELM
jgi:hypothetical protein